MEVYDVGKGISQVGVQKLCSLIEMVAERSRGSVEIEFYYC